METLQKLKPLHNVSLSADAPTVSSVWPYVEQVTDNLLSAAQELNVSEQFMLVVGIEQMQKRLDYLQEELLNTN